MSDTGCDGDGVSQPDPEASGADAQRAEARRLWESERYSARRTAETIGVHHATISRWIAQARAAGDPWIKDGERRDRVPTPEELEEALKRRQRAETHARITWALRRSDEADAAGVTASYARTKWHALMEGGDHKGADSAIKGYEKFLDAAQLLSGGTEDSEMRLAAEQARLLVGVVRGVLTDPELGLNAAQQEAAPVVAQRHLRSVDAEGA